MQVLGTNDSVVEHVTQLSIQEAIWSNIHNKCLCLAEEAPVWQGRLCEELGYNMVLDTASAILAGTYVYPEDFNEATKELCRGCVLMREIVPQDSVGIKITREDNWDHWRRTKEETSSSKSGMHFGHYMAKPLSSLHTFFTSMP